MFVDRLDAAAQGRAAPARAAVSSRSSLVEWRCWSSRSRCSSTRSATAASPASWRCTRDATGVTPRALYFTVFSIAIMVDAAVRRPGSAIASATARVFVPCLALVVAGLRVARVGGSRGRCSSRRRSSSARASAPRTRCFSRHVMRHVDDGAPRRGLRQHHRRVRHRHRHRLDRDGVDRAALRLPDGVRHGRRAGRCSRCRTSWWSSRRCCRLTRPFTS